MQRGCGDEGSGVHACVWVHLYGGATHRAGGSAGAPNGEAACFFFGGLAHVPLAHWI